VIKMPPGKKDLMTQSRDKGMLYTAEHKIKAAHIAGPKKIKKHQ